MTYSQGSDFNTGPIWDAMKFAETPKPFDWGGTLAGIGALGEGVGNLIRGIRGELPAPMGMATSKLSEYFNRDKQDSSLAILLEKLLREKEEDIDLKTKTGSTDISKAGGI
jgi:hypothetical protein